MTRDEALARYRPIRAGIRRVLKGAQASCSKADFMRSAKLLGLEAEGTIVLDGDEEAAMLADVALFEPNQRGNRAFDRFLKAGANRLEPSDRAVAERMAGAFFSVFRVAGRHEAAGVWLEDLLNAGRGGDGRLWLMDESFEASVPADGPIAGRLFDAGPFHAAFGIFVGVDEEAAEDLRADAEADGRPPLGRHLVPMLYGLHIHSRALAEIIAEDPLLALLAEDPDGGFGGLFGPADEGGAAAAQPGRGRSAAAGLSSPRRRGAGRGAPRSGGR